MFTLCSNITDNTGDRALLSVRFPIQLEGSNIISDNIEGGGVSLLDTRMDTKGSILFEGNSAVYGGAIAIEDEGLVCVSSTVHPSVDFSYSIFRIYHIP